ncbi:MAG TPA: MgtC/SapB family protein [Bacteroidales bacterium]|jgi:putative Mg2+ transporter-C (MgtC) family protein|nr:MgtC/SapB family protein [Bacteroidales bacterium]
MDHKEFILRLLAALFAGLVIGIEREWQNKPAGLRTNTLVATGSALFVMLSVLITVTYGKIPDVTRIIGQVVTGIGFLGGGIIFKEGTDIHGLTTAATVWCSAAVGCLAGAGFFVETLIGVVAVVSVNLLLVPLDKWMEKRAKEGGGRLRKRE